MSHQAPLLPDSATVDPGRQIAQLREALRLVDRIAGRPAPPSIAGLDESARLTIAYERAVPVARRRFDALSAEAVVWVAAGVEALIAAGEPPPRAAALRLAQSIEASLRELCDLLC